MLKVQSQHGLHNETSSGGGGASQHWEGRGREEKNVSHKVRLHSKQPTSHRGLRVPQKPVPLHYPVPIPGHSLLQNSLQEESSRGFDEAPAVSTTFPPPPHSTVQTHIKQLIQLTGRQEGEAWTKIAGRVPTGSTWNACLAQFKNKKRLSSIPSVQLSSRTVYLSVSNEFQFPNNSQVYFQISENTGGVHIIRLNVK